MEVVINVWSAADLLGVPKNMLAINWFKKILPIFVLLVALTVVASALPLGNNDKSIDNDVNQQEIIYSGIEGKTALDILKSGHEVEVQNYEGIGEFVTSINGRKVAVDEFWAFYINGQMAQVGASQYITKQGETIEWKIEKIK